MLNICSKGHEEICYDGTIAQCPICKLQKELEDEETRYNELNEEHKDTVTHLQSLEDKNVLLREQIDPNVLKYYMHTVSTLTPKPIQIIKY